MSKKFVLTVSVVCFAVGALISNTVFAEKTKKADGLYKELELFCNIRVLDSYSREGWKLGKEPVFCQQKQLLESGQSRKGYEVFSAHPLKYFL